MRRIPALLAGMGALAVGGLALSAWGNQLLFEDLAGERGEIGAGGSLAVKSHMGQSQKGVFAVEVADPDPGVIRATVSGPGGGRIAEEAVDGGAFEGYFDAGAGGEYTLTVENAGGGAKRVAGYIGPEPDASKRAVAFVSMYVLVVGLVGMPAAAAYAVITRKRRG